MSSRMIWVLAFLSACGGGGDDGTGPDSQPVASVTVTPAALSLTVGGTGQLTAEPRDASGSALPGRAVTWSSTDLAVATVSNAGLVTAIAPGATTIAATSEGKSGAAALAIVPRVSLARIVGTWSGQVTEIRPGFFFHYTTVITIPGPGPLAPGSLAGSVSYTGDIAQCSGELSYRSEGANFLEFSERITAGGGCIPFEAVRLGPFTSDGVRLNFEGQVGNSKASAVLSRSP